MQTLTKEVKSARVAGSDKPNPKGRVVVGVATYPQYDTLQECLDNIGEAEVVRLVNVQTETTALNIVREEKTGSPSAETLRKQALANVTTDQAKLQKLVACAGDQVKIGQLIDAEVAEIKAAKGITAEDGTPA